jgi:hypothetical protein
VIGGFEGEAFTFGAPGVGAIEIWDPLSQAFAPSGSLLAKRGLHTATLRDGSILVVGGLDADEGRLSTLGSTEWWDPASSTPRAAASLKVARSGHTATLMPDGRVLIVGGDDAGENVLVSTEIWTP